MQLARLLALSLALPAALSAQAPSTPGITLADAIAKAQLAQPSVVAAQGAVSRAAAQYKSSWGAFIPSLSVNSSYGTSYSNGPSRVNQITNEIISGESYAQSFSNSASASVDLFTGFRRGANMNSAKATGSRRRRRVDRRPVPDHRSAPNRPFLPRWPPPIW